MMTFKLKSVVATIVIVATFAISAIGAGSAHAFTFTNSSSAALAGLIATNNIIGGLSSQELSNLVVLNELFGPSTIGSVANKNLAGLIAVDGVTGGGTNAQDIASLIVVNGLFDK